MRDRRYEGRWSGLAAAILLGALLPASARADAEAEAPRCKEACEAERKQIEEKRRRCLDAAADLPKAQAARYRVKCRSELVPPRCEGLPACPSEAKPRQHTPGLVLGPLVLSAVRRGSALARPTYAPGAQLCARVEVTFTSQPAQTKLWLQLDLQLLAPQPKGEPRVVVRWDKYFEKQKFLDPTDRRVPLRFTLHGGAVLPPDFKPGQYLAQATVRERTSSVTAVASGTFRVVGSFKPERPGSKK